MNMFLLFHLSYRPSDLLSGTLSGTAHCRPSLVALIVRR